MPKFDVMITQTITIYGEIEVTAKDEDAAQEKVQEMLDNNEIPEMDWSIPTVKNKKIDAIEWENQESVRQEIEQVSEV
jgi:hypothetical protein